MTEFTPGPWRWHSLMQRWEHGGADADEYVLIDLDTVCGPQLPSEADAHLIAAAPDLYAAVEDLMWHLRSLTVLYRAVGLDVVDEEAQIERVEAVLSKARGFQ